MEEKVNPADFSILVCDDEESICKLLGTAIAEWGFQVRTFPSGEDAVNHMAQGHLPHIILTDLRMGAIGGIELAEKAKQLSPEIEVIIMTAQASFDTAVRAMRIGVFDYLCKPFDDLDHVRKTLLHVAERIHLRVRNVQLLLELSRRNVEISAMATMSLELSKNKDLTKALQIGCEGLSKGFGNCPVAFFQFVPAKKALIGAVRHPARLFGNVQPMIPVPAESASSVKGFVDFFENIDGQPALVEQLENAQAASGDAAQFSAQGEWRSAALISGGVPRGVFSLYVERWNGDESKQLLDGYLNTIATAFENALSHAWLQETSIRDELTGLHNVRHLRTILGTEIKRSRRLEHPMSLVFFDVDHFKKYNDRHGHPAGDEVLSELAALVKRSFRATDTCARYGGEEFCVVMPDTALDDALGKAERFRDEVEKHPFPKEGTQPLGKVTVSIGVAEYPSHGSSAEMVIQAADEALYRAKEKSRNLVACAVPPGGYVQPFTSRPVRSATIGPSEPRVAASPPVPKLG